MSPEETEKRDEPAGPGSSAQGGPKSAGEQGGTGGPSAQEAEREKREREGREREDEGGQEPPGQPAPGQTAGTGAARSQ